MGGLANNGFDSEILKALADDVRIEILETIGLKELNVNEIAQKTSVSRPTVSHHLQILKRADLVSARKDGKETFYSVNTYTLTSISQSLLGFINFGKFQ
ncbi:MAG TPA: transcriptional regulator [Clostridiales bacterium]|jgi:DNA-binding transcriptional ArsR family regulator|nr:transcriptional regulator [Clostridiales bacterium]